MRLTESLEALTAFTLACGIVFAFSFENCKSTKEAEEALIKSAAEASYYAQQLDCVERYDTREAIDRCRDDVKYRWRREQYADAGLE